MDWVVRKKADIGRVLYTPQITQPRNAELDPAFGNFNLPLPEQNSPGATGTGSVVAMGQPQTMDVAGTPTNDRLKQLAAENPPPSKWFQGDEEDLF